MDKDSQIVRGAGASDKPAPAETEEKRETLADQPSDAATEIGGPQGPEPTRYGDWERKGRCIDF